MFQPYRLHKLNEKEDSVSDPSQSVWLFSVYFSKLSYFYVHVDIENHGNIQHLASTIIHTEKTTHFSSNPDSWATLFIETFYIVLKLFLLLHSSTVLATWTLCTLYFSPLFLTSKATGWCSRLLYQWQYQLCANVINDNNVTSNRQTSITMEKCTS